MVMLTRISIKVRLASSTAARTGFMILECGLGLYTLAALHLIGHSLYMAHAFLAASGAVRDMRRYAPVAEGTRCRAAWGGVHAEARMPAYSCRLAGDVENLYKFVPVEAERAVKDWFGMLVLCAQVLDWLR